MERPYKEVGSFEKHKSKRFHTYRAIGYSTADRIGYK